MDDQERVIKALILDVNIILGFNLTQEHGLLHGPIHGFPCILQVNDSLSELVDVSKHASIGDVIAGQQLQLVQSNSNCLFQIVLALIMVKKLKVNSSSIIVRSMHSDQGEWIGSMHSGLPDTVVKGVPGVIQRPILSCLRWNVKLLIKYVTQSMSGC